MSEATAAAKKPRKSESKPAPSLVLGVVLYRRGGGREEMHAKLAHWPVSIEGGDRIGLPQVTNTGDVVITRELSAQEKVHDLLNNAVLVGLGHDRGQWNIDPGSWDRQIAALEAVGFKKGAWVP